MSDGATPATDAPEESGRPAVTILREDPNPGLLRGSLHALYDLAWLSVAVLGSPWLFYKSLRRPDFGRMILEQLGRGLPDLRAGRRPRILVHGVSVGEVKSAQPIVAAIEEAYPELEVVISTSTTTGLEVAHREYPSHRVVRFPSDISFVTRRFLRRVDPALVLLVELEIWPNFLRQCNRTGRPVAVVNGRITEGSHGRYLLFRKLLPQFNRISLICVQLPEYARRFRALDVDPGRIFVTGNVKVDGLQIGPVDPGAELLRLLGPAPGPSEAERQKVLVAGSTHAPEERAFACLCREVVPEARLILVPRHPHRCAEIAAELAEQGIVVQLLSQLRTGAERPDPRRVALVDTIGELQRVYGLADLVFVGGTLIPHGGQNMLEPAAQGKAVVFGPYVQNFTQEAVLLVGAGAGRQVADEEELGRALVECLGDSGLRERMGECGMQAVADQRGATEKTLRALDALDLAHLPG